jgi:hypothetical protein
MATPSAFADAAETWNLRCAGDEFLFGTEPNARLRAQAAHLPPCGQVLSVWLARQGLRVDAFDVADRAVEKACGLARRAGVSVHFAVTDVALRAYEADVREGQGQGQDHQGRSALVGAGRTGDPPVNLLRPSRTPTPTPTFRHSSPTCP